MSRKRQPSFEGVFLLSEPPALLSLCLLLPLPLFSSWFAFKLSNIPTATSGAPSSPLEVKDFAFSGAHFIPISLSLYLSLSRLYNPL